MCVERPPNGGVLFLDFKLQQSSRVFVVVNEIYILDEPAIPRLQWGERIPIRSEIRLLIISVQKMTCAI